MANETEIVNDDGCTCPTCERARELTMDCLTLTMKKPGTAVEWYMAMVSAGATIVANKLGPLDQLTAANSMRDVANRIEAHAKKTMEERLGVKAPEATEVKDEQDHKASTN